jgi:hypothetical protein
MGILPFFSALRNDVGNVHMLLMGCDTQRETFCLPQTS